MTNRSALKPPVSLRSVCHSRLTFCFHRLAFAFFVFFSFLSQRFPKFSLPVTLRLLGLNFDIYALSKQGFKNPKRKKKILLYKSKIVNSELWKHFFSFKLLKTFLLLDIFCSFPNLPFTVWIYPTWLKRSRVSLTSARVGLGMRTLTSGFCL